MRSLITLKALTYAPTGGMVAAPTTSLPECIGGARNWDYRFCWLRDATLTLLALMNAGYYDEARMWRDWLLRAAAGSPQQIQIMYGIRGERRLTEWEVPWLPGYEDRSRCASAMPRTINCSSIFSARSWTRCTRRARAGLAPRNPAGTCNANSSRIWKRSGPSATRASGKCAAGASTSPIPRRWPGSPSTARSRARRNSICPGRSTAGARFASASMTTSARAASTTNSAVSCAAYGSKELDASLLLLPAIGFLPPEDPRIRGTIEAIERGLMVDGLVRRYDTAKSDDGLPPGEGMFLACSFWLVDAYLMIGRRDDAVRLFERLLSLRNDLGLLSEQYEPRTRRLVGNFPQAFSHLALVNSASNLAISKSRPNNAQSVPSPASRPCARPAV